MDKATQSHLAKLWSIDRQLQNEAFTSVLKSTDKPVDWAYEVWDELLANLTDKVSFVLAGLKALLEQDINLNLVADHFPNGMGE